MAPPRRSSPDQVCLGAIAGAFGVRGEARLKPFTAAPKDIAAYGPVRLEDGSRTFDVTLTRPIKGGYAARLSGVRTREEAEALRGARLYVDRSRLPDPDEDEFYHADLIGMTVEDLTGRALGRVKAVQNYGAGDYLEVLTPGAPAPALLPFTRDAVPHVDVAGRKIIADPPEGVFEDAGGAGGAGGAAPNNPDNDLGDDPDNAPEDTPESRPDVNPNANPDSPPDATPDQERAS